MWQESSESNRPLRFGYTTGACATVTSLAAARLLLTGTGCSMASIDLPKGQRVEFTLDDCRLTDEGAAAAVIKDAGDDPDVTHGARIFAHVRLLPEPGVHFRAGPGVGTVTREGLVLAVGEPAINPVPRQMMTAHLLALAKEQSYHGGFEVSIGVEKGAALALKTMNPRLGILGGLSILGTTGIVRPFSCAAYIASIHQGIDVARANGLHTLVASTGNTSETAIQQVYPLPEMALIEMGDFVGAVLKYLKRAPVDKLVLAGGFGKLSKLARGHLDLHSRKSAIDFTHLAAQAGALGASETLRENIRQCNTSLQALQLSEQAGIALGERICQLARVQARQRLPEQIQVEVWAFNKQGQCVGSAT